VGSDRASHQSQGEEVGGHLDWHLKLLASIVHRDDGLGMDHGTHGAAEASE
jgi:hypothetical protein